MVLRRVESMCQVWQLWLSQGMHQDYQETATDFNVRLGVDDPSGGGL